MAFTLKDKVIGDIDLLDGSHSSAFQAAGNELTALQALADTAGFLKKTGDGAYTIDTSTYLSGSIKLDDLSAPDDNTDLNASTSAHGLLLKAVAPASGLINLVGIANGETVYKMVAMFDATDPSTQAFGDTASVGSAAVAARRDHKHAMPANPVGTELALQTMTQKTGQTIDTTWRSFDPTTSDVTFVDGAVYLMKLKVTGTTTTSIMEAVGMFVWKTNGPGEAAAQSNEIPLVVVSQTATATDLKIFCKQYSAGSGATWSLYISADTNLGASAKIDASFRRVI